MDVSGSESRSERETSVSKSVKLFLFSKPYLVGVVLVHLQFSMSPSD